MARHFGLLARLWRSAWSAAAYREVAAGSVPSLLGYLAVLIGVAAAVTTGQMQLGLVQAVREFKISKGWEANLPEIRIEGGTVSSPVAQPFVWEHEGFIFMLDTTGATTDLDPAYRTGVLVTKTDVLIRRQRGLQETRRYSLEQAPDMVLNQATIERWLDRIAAWAWLAVGVALLAWLWIAKLFQVFCWSLLGVLVRTLAKRSMRYGAVVNVSIFALTVPFVFDGLKDGLGWRHGSLGWVSLALYVGYLIWGILVQPAASAETVDSTPSAVTAPS